MYSQRTLSRNGLSSTASAAPTASTTLYHPATGDICLSHHASSGSKISY